MQTWTISISTLKQIITFISEQKSIKIWTFCIFILKYIKEFFNDFHLCLFLFYDFNKLFSYILMSTSCYLQHHPISHLLFKLTIQLFYRFHIYRFHVFIWSVNLLVRKGNSMKWDHISMSVEKRLAHMYIGLQPEVARFIVLCEGSNLSSCN